MTKIIVNKTQTGESWRLTIPKELLKAKNIGPGDEVDFYINSDGNIAIKKVET